MFNGCELNRNYTVVELNMKTKEGKAKQLVLNKLKQKANRKAIQTINYEVDKAYDEAIKENLTALNTAKVTAFNALQVKTSFFITYLLVQKAKNDKHLWANALLALPEEKKKKKRTISRVIRDRFKSRASRFHFQKSNIYADTVLSVQRVLNAEKKYHVLTKECTRIKNKYPIYTKFLQSMKHKKMTRQEAAKRIAFHYFYKYYLQLPKSLLVASDILNDIILGDGFLVFAKYVQQIAEAQESKKLDIEIVYDSIQAYAHAFVIQYNNTNATKPVELALKRLEWAGRSCSGLLCEMFCQLYVINLASGKCDYDPEERGHQLFIDKTVNEGCRGIEDRAYFVDADRIAPENLRYCKKGRTGKEEVDICIAHALTRTTKRIQSHCKGNKGANVVLRTFESQRMFGIAFKKCSMGSKYTGLANLQDFCGTKRCKNVARSIQSKSLSFVLHC